MIGLFGRGGLLLFMIGLAVLVKMSLDYPAPDFWIPFPFIVMISFGATLYLFCGDRHE